MLNPTPSANFNIIRRVDTADEIITAAAIFNATHTGQAK